ncbi:MULTISPECIES: NAD(P)-dependent oxidoreductase [Actinomadura]|uniref:NAD-dependent epimerase/dehydratase family protein n=1 Tax=Actinomadura litoris TaxID=2678616 RepID=A0A7K1L3X8_9ACTN|nr:MULTISPECIES: NAD-dependent epimerase/dehydratase family protein [Actinomadura]MBT2210069.1 NAD(P)-dependent oxidoreductase [Actinomadura sp. NEAU-AAG7]MUN39107.1 NAD-dependent epimerase/dehydratase family protein [Actinomadura litoris]
MSRILLVGATGFVGRHVRARAAATGVEIVAASRSPEPGVLGLDLAAGAARVGDALRDIAPDVVVNCAGVTAGSPADLVRGNVVAVANLVTALAAAERPVRLVHLGSAAEYGEVEHGTPVTESTRPRPHSLYGVTKLAGTELVGGAPGAVVLRVFNPVGPGSPGSTLAGRLAGELRRTDGTDEDVHVGPLTASRDLVDVRDVADAVLTAALAPGALPPVLNVGSGRATPLRDLAALLLRVTGSRRRVLEAAATGSERSSGVAWQQADIRAIGHVLGWAPATDLATSLRDLWAETACPG